MIKLVFNLRRREGMSREEFQRYWREHHAPLVRKHADTLRIRRYVQVHAEPEPAQEALRASRGAPEPFDGTAELWWESEGDLQAALASPEAQSAGRELLEDERRFIDHARSPIWIAREHEFVRR